MVESGPQKPWKDDREIKVGIPGRLQAGLIFFGYRRRVSEKQGEIDALEIDAPELSRRGAVAGRRFFDAAVRRIAAAAAADRQPPADLVSPGRRLSGAARRAQLRKLARLP